MRVAYLLLGLSLFIVPPLLADTVEISPDDDWAAEINRLEPGDTAHLAPGTYTAGSGDSRTISVQGTADQPIIIQGAGHLESTFDGQKNGFALKLQDCEHLILENVGITNPSPLGVDGRVHYHTDETGRPTAASDLAEGIIVTGGAEITIRESRFFDIATRGILVGSGTDGITVVHNLFLRVGDDTAAADLAVGRPVEHVTVRENLMAGNVDGVMFEGPDGANLIERNLIVFHRWEDGIDLKMVSRMENDPAPDDRWTTVRRNVIYAHRSQFSGITIQISTDNVKVYENILHGHAGMHGARDGGNAMMVRARNGDTEHLEIVGNWFDGGFGNNPGGRGIRLEFDGRRPGNTLRDIWILHNIITDVPVGLSIVDGSNINVYNNIFSNTAIKVDIMDIKGGANLYDRTYNWAGKTRTWSGDKSPIRGKPVYKMAPVGLLAESSPGKGQAADLPDHDWGADVGLPPSAADLPELERSILRTIENYFTEDEIREALNQGGLRYKPGVGVSAVGEDD
jgi:hypothetical protein